MTELIASMALLTSVLSLVVSFMGYRAAGPKVVVAAHEFEVRGNELWLEVRLANAGRGDVDLDGASCDALGPTLTLLPHRLHSGSSHLLSFRTALRRELAGVAGVTLAVGLGSGHSLVEQLRFSEVDLARISTAGARPPGSSTPGWIPPTQEEIP